MAAWGPNFNDAGGDLQVLHSAASVKVDAQEADSVASLLEQVAQEDWTPADAAGGFSR